jgi:hypothetical protein
VTGVDPLEVAVEVACPPLDAFATWTERIDLWWPKGHTVSGEPSATVVLEPGVGGRIDERTGDGRELGWGEVTRWEPADRLAYLWHIRRDRSDATDVEITFVDRGDGSTRVEIRHTGWARRAPSGAKPTAAAGPGCCPTSPSSWPPPPAATPDRGDP